MTSAHRPREAPSGAASGFTLIELAVVIVIVALLLGAILTPLATQIQLRKNKEAEEALADIREALIGYAITQGNFPCPDTDRDGLENLETTPPPRCEMGTVEGFLPWQDLGVAPVDPWGRLYRYRVTAEFTWPAQTGQPPATDQLDLTDVGDIRINTRGDNPGAGAGGETKEDIVLTGSAVAAVLTHGANGAGARTLDGDLIAVPAAGTDEDVNRDGASPVSPAPHFYARQITPRATTACSETVEGQPFCDYDDLVIWVSTPVLMNRMVQAGQLP